MCYRYLHEVNKQYSAALFYSHKFKKNDKIQKNNKDNTEKISEILRN